MRFQTGALGVVVVMIALVGMLMGSWVMSMDVTEEEVTKYNALTEIGGLFDSEKTPTFTDYNPSTNYTGYYTGDSVINGTIYFDGVDFQQSNTPNQFRIKMPPVDPDTDLFTLQDSYTVGGVTYDADDTRFIYRYSSSLVNDTYTHTYSYTVHDLAVCLGYSGKILTITSTNTPEDWSDPDDRFITFVPKSKTVMNQALPPERVAYVVNPDIGVTDDDPAAKYRVLPMLACVYDQTTEMVNLYYDVELTRLAVQGLAATDVYIWFDDLGEDFLGNQIDVYSETVVAAQYMDPSKGVVMDD